MRRDIFEMEEAMGLHATARYLHAYVMPESEARVIEEAAHLAYDGQAFRAESVRKQAGYHGLDSDFGGVTKYDFERVQRELG